MVEFAGFKCEIQIRKYQSGYKAITLIDQEDSMPVATATVNVEGLTSDEVAIKDYSENKGMYDALLNAGVITPKHKELSTGYVNVPVCFLTPNYYID